MASVLLEQPDVRTADVVICRLEDPRSRAFEQPDVRTANVVICYGSSHVRRHPVKPRMPERVELQKTLRPLHVGSLALGCIIGFGCFVLAGDFLAALGTRGCRASGSSRARSSCCSSRRAMPRSIERFPVAGAEFAHAYYAAGPVPRLRVRLVPDARLSLHHPVERDRARASRRLSSRPSSSPAVTSTASRGSTSISAKCCSRRARSSSSATSTTEA